MAKKKYLELAQSEVVFNAEDHTYWLGEKQLQGITGLIDRQLFPNTYDGVSEQMLAQAAEYGTAVHGSIELFDSQWQNDGTIEVQDYIQLCKDNNLVHESSEYLISDGEHFASMIDKVYRVSEDTFDIGDIKTYGVMNPEKLEKARWQLSIYAYLFELQNAKAKIGRLFILHIRNKQKQDGTFDHISNFVPVDRIPAEICKELLDAESSGAQFENPFSIPDDIREQESLIRKLIETQKDCEEKLAKIKASIFEKMELQGVKSWCTETMKLTRKMPSTRSSFSLPMFKEAFPDIDTTPYMKVSEVKGSLQITV